MGKKKIYLFVGRTASGKTYLASKLAESSGRKVLKSYTTREKRDENDTDHIFIDEDFYKEQKEKGNILTETKIGDIYYFTTPELFEECDFYTIDPNGIKSLLDNVGDRYDFVVLYFSASQEVRRKRFKKRKFSTTALFYDREYNEREQFDEFELSEQYNYLIDNDFEVDSDFILGKNISLLKRIIRCEENGCVNCENYGCKHDMEKLKGKR